jgi:hypothetical protein
MHHKILNKLRPVVLALMTLTGLSVVKGDTPFVVVAIRQYQVVGASNIHLYLYGLDGKLKKQLTNTPGLDDEQPALDYEGQTVIFTRTASNSKLKAKAGRYILDLTTGDLHQLSPGVTDNNDESSYSPGSSFDPLDSWNTWPPDPKEGAGATSISSIDSSYKLVTLPKTIDTDPGNPGTTFLVQTKTDPSPVPITDLPGFMPLADVDNHESFYGVNNSPFILGPSFAATFLRHHLGSTDGQQIWGLDLTAKKWTKMSENGGDLYHLPNAAGVFLVASSLYEPLGKTGKSVNCAYLEWWDAHLKMARLSPPLSVFYGAAFHFDEGENAVIYEIWGS